MQFLTLMVSLLTGIAWPLAIVAVALMFKEPLKTMLPRLKKAGPTGFEFDPLQAQQITKQKQDPTELKELPGLARTDFMAQVERVLHGQLQLFDEDKKIDILVRHLAQSRLETAFERIYSVIFGSQLAALRLLELSDGMVLRSEVLKLFDDAKVMFPSMHQSRTPEYWLQYLFVNELVIAKGDDLELTEFGKEFRFYQKARNLSDEKPF